jgi:hypothetical protein
MFFVYLLYSLILVHAVSGISDQSAASFDDMSSLL